jgi:hypothetical protein
VTATGTASNTSTSSGTSSTSDTGSGGTTWATEGTDTEGKMVADCRSVQDPEDCRRTESPAGNPCDVYEVRHVNVADCSPAGETGTASLCLEYFTSGTTDPGCPPYWAAYVVTHQLLTDGTAYILITGAPCGGPAGPLLEGSCIYADEAPAFPLESAEWLWDPEVCSCGGPPPGWPF